MIALFLALAPICLPPQAPQAAAPRRDPLERVVVVGASLSAGFGAEHTFVEALQASLRLHPDRPILGLGDVLFFTSPKAAGSKQVEAALDANPSLVVAIDFLFWFGYGTQGARGAPITEEAQRLELLEVGLGLLEDFECPLVIGDFPDMSAAVGTMLVQAQVPTPSTLPLLSRRVREWAAARPATVVLPLSELVAKLGKGGEVQIGRHTFHADTPLLQADHLHPTLAGLVSMAQLACDELVTARFLPETAVVGDLDAVWTKLGRRPVLK